MTGVYIGRNVDRLGCAFIMLDVAYTVAFDLLQIFLQGHRRTIIVRSAVTSIGFRVYCVGSENVAVPTIVTTVNHTDTQYIRAVGEMIGGCPIQHRITLHKSAKEIVDVCAALSCIDQ